MKSSSDPDGSFRTDRRSFLGLASASAIQAKAGVPSPPHMSTRRPNIVIVMADQHHASLTKSSGFPLDVMPALDHLAAQGARFKQAYACAPLCVPSRVSMLTGRWPHAHRVRQNSAAQHAVFEKDLFDIVKALGWQWLRGLEEDANPGYDSDWRRTRSNYLGMLRLIDDQLHRLVSFLDEKNLRSNTLIVYLSDHGDYFCDYGLVHKGAGLPEDLVRIPMVWSGAGVTPQAGLDDVFVSTADVMPTLCEALGVEIPPGSQGRSLWPLLRKQPYPKEEFSSTTLHLIRTSSTICSRIHQVHLCAASYCRNFSSGPSEPRTTCRSLPIRPSGRSETGMRPIKKDAHLPDAFHTAFDRTTTS